MQWKVEELWQQIHTLQEFKRKIKETEDQILGKKTFRYLKTKFTLFSVREQMIPSSSEVQKVPEGMRKIAKEETVKSQNENTNPVMFENFMKNEAKKRS